MNGEVAGTFIYNGVPQNGATAQLWKITGFAAYADSTDEVENNPLEAVDIELDVNAGGTFAIGDVIKIATEVLRITDISTNKLYVIRGYRATAPAQHVQNTQIDDETVTEPAQDTAVPAGSQQGGDVTTGVAYGGDGAYRWTAVPEGEYYVSVTYDGHIAWLYVSVESNDPTPLQILTDDGDLMIRNADRETRLPGGANGNYLKMDANRPVWGGGTTGATLEFFIPATGASGGGVASLNIGDFPVVELDGLGEFAYMAFKVPHDFANITNAEVIIIPTSTQAAADYDTQTDYGQIGEAYTTHSEENNASTYNVTNNQLFAVDIAGILSAIAANDYVGVAFEQANAAHNVDCVGLRFKYAT